MKPTFVQIVADLLSKKTELQRVQLLQKRGFYTATFKDPERCALTLIEKSVDRTYRNSTFATFKYDQYLSTTKYDHHYNRSKRPNWTLKEKQKLQESNQRRLNGGRRVTNNFTLSGTLEYLEEDALRDAHLNQWLDEASYSPSWRNEWEKEFEKQYWKDIEAENEMVFNNCGDLEEYCLV